jgi:hypothetical protein
MARGLGAFADQFTEGVLVSKKLAREKALAEAEAKRLGFEEERLSIERDRAKQAAEQFGLTSQLTKQQIESGQLDLAQRKRDAEFQQSQSKRLADLVQQSRGGVQVDAIDPTGKPVGMMSFGSMEEATQALQSKGLTFRPGSAKQVAALNPVDLEMRAADIMLEEALRYGKVTPELLKEAKNRRKEAEREGAIEALRYYHTTGDEAGAKAMFNKNGKIKIGDDVKLELKPGMFGPTVAGFKIGKDGKRVEVFDGFRDIILPSMSSDAYAATMAQFKRDEQKELGDDRRADKAANTAITTTRMNNAGAMDRELLQDARARTKEKDPKFQELETIIMDPARAAFSNPNYAINLEERMQDTMNVMNTAYALYSSGKAKSAPEAAAMAMQLVKQAKANAQNKPK